VSGADRNADEELLASFTAFVFDHPDPVVALFGDNLAGWGSEWVGLEPQPGVASDQLVKTVNSTIESARDLVQLFAEHRHSRFWEQTYDASDGLVSDDMLSCYGFVELLGPRGPFVSTRIRGGLGLYGANITYPLHHHGPDEVYLPVSGAADFTVAGDTSTRRAGEAIHVPSGTEHGFRTGDAPLVQLYLWQNGELRETSTFI